MAANVIKTELKRFQLQHQTVQLTALYVDKTLSQVAKGANNSINDTNYYVEGTVFTTNTYPSDTHKPTWNTEGLGSAWLQFGADQISTACMVYIDSSVSVAYSDASGQSGYTTFTTYFIIVTTDDYYVICPKTFKLATSTLSTRYTITNPTETQYGYFTSVDARNHFSNMNLNTVNSKESRLTVISNYLKGVEIIIPSDPYAEGGTSETGGGTGNFDGTTASVDFPAATPTAGASNSGFIKLFNPSAANLTALATYLWGTFDISSFKSIYNNPIDCIIALLVVPVAPTVGTAGTISLGNIATNVSAPVISDQFVIFDCGSININEYWGAYLDYDPYTKCEIYLPYIGVQDIDINDIQGKTIQLKYYIDVLSGACVAMLKCDEDILYNWSGQCGAEVPITATGFGNAFQTALSVGNAIGETIVNAMSGIPQSLALVASSVFNGARSKVHKSGSIGSMAGHMGIQKPYLIITRPVQSVPENLNEITGYPSNITATLGDLSGYTEIDTIHLAGIPATSEELAEIDELLKGGVFI